MGKLVVIVVFLVALVTLGFVLLNWHKAYAPAVSPDTKLLADIAVWYPSAPWSKPASDKQTVLYGDFTGQSIHAAVTTQQALLNHFEDVSALAKMGYLPDNSLSADGPGSSTWGYSNSSGSAKKIILFSYSVKPSSSNPNEPLQFNCPCGATVNVFVGTSVTSATGMANPASVNCTKVGGTLLIKKRGDGGEYGLCDFGDNMQCEEWALFRGDCPVGGRKTTGFDTIDQKYCAWLGGKIIAEANASCTLPNGHVCTDAGLYNETCQ